MVHLFSLTILRHKNCLVKPRYAFDNNLLFALLLFNKRLEDVRRIILHNISLAASDYPYQKGYSVVCRCLISFHTVGNNNNNNNKRKKEKERRG